MSDHIEIACKASECASPEGFLIVLDTVCVEPLRLVAEVPKVIDDGVTRFIDEPSCTASENERFCLDYSPKPNRAFVSLMP